MSKAQRILPACLWFGGVSVLVVYLLLATQRDLNNQNYVITKPETHGTIALAQSFVSQAAQQLVTTGRVDAAKIENILHNSGLPVDALVSLALIRTAITSHVLTTQCNQNSQNQHTSEQLLLEAMAKAEPNTTQSLDVFKQMIEKLTSEKVAIEQECRTKLEAIKKEKDIMEEDKKKIMVENNDLKQKVDTLAKQLADTKAQLQTAQNTAQNAAQNTPPEKCPTTTTTTTTTTEPSSSGWKRTWGNPNRSVHCLRYPDDSEACLYTSICVQDDKIYVRDLFGDLRQFGGRGVDYRYYEKTKNIPIEELNSPFTTEGHFEAIPDKNWQSFISEAGTTVLNNAYFAALQPQVTSGGNNMWHFSQSVTMFLDAQFHNETGVYPPMDHMVVRAGGELNKWTENMLELLKPTESTPLILLEKGQRVCANNAMLIGYRRGLFLGRDDGTLFRERAYQRLKLDIHPKQNEFLSYPLRIKIFNRPGSRTLANPNPQAMKQLLLADGGPEMYDIQIQESLAEVPFVDQVKLWANSDLIIMPHGAGLTNMIFARNHVPVIEIFPRHFYMELYRHVALGSNHPYFCLMSEKLPDHDFRANPVDAVNCEYWHGIDIMNQGQCHNQYFKHSSITLNSTFFLHTVKLALEALPLESYPGRHQTWDPIRPAGDPLGTPKEK